MPVLERRRLCHFPSFAHPGWRLSDSRYDVRLAVAVVEVWLLEMNTKAGVDSFVLSFQYKAPGGPSPPIQDPASNGMTWGLC